MFGGDHVVAREAEVIGEHLADFTVVIDDGDARHELILVRLVQLKQIDRGLATG